MGMLMVLSEDILEWFGILVMLSLFAGSFVHG